MTKRELKCPQSVKLHLSLYTDTIVATSDKKLSSVIVTVDVTETEMEQSFSGFSNDADNEEVPVFATYLLMIMGLISVVIVITLDAIVINVIQWTRELHTKYFFLVAHLLGTDVAGIIVRFFRQCLIIILY